MGPKRRAGKSCCGGAVKFATRDVNRKGLLGAVNHEDGTVEEDERVMDVCLKSISLHLDGQRTRYGFVEDASLRIRGVLDVTSIGESTKDVTLSDEYTLQEVVELCDNPQNDIAAVVVDVSGLEDETLHGGKVRCWFVGKSQKGGVDFSADTSGTRRTWARTRYAAPENEAKHPLYKLENFAEPACLTGTCILSKEGLSEGCQAMGREYCRRSKNDVPNMRSQWCTKFFQSPTSNVDTLLRNYCGDAVAATLKGGGRLRNLDPRDRTLCGCFYPEAVYNDYFKRFPGKSHVTAPCTFSPCANSIIKPFNIKTGKVPCPDVVECNQQCNVSIHAKVVDNVNCMQKCILNVAKEEAKKNATRRYNPARALSNFDPKKPGDEPSYCTTTWVFGALLLAGVLLFVKSKRDAKKKKTL